jgi:adenylyl cyclase-associated protein
VTEFVNNCKTLGAEVEGQGALVLAAFQAQKAMLEVAASSKKPSGAAFASVIADTSTALSAVQDAERTAPRKTTQFNHLKAVAESIPALGWVTVSPKPGPFVKDMKEAGEFYGNRVIKDNKDKDKSHVTWARSYTAIWVALQAYVKEYHTTGLSWNPTGGEASAPVSDSFPFNFASICRTPTTRFSQCALAVVSSY